MRALAQATALLTMHAWVVPTKTMQAKCSRWNYQMSCSAGDKAMAAAIVQHPASNKLFRGPAVCKRLMTQDMLQYIMGSSYRRLCWHLGCGSKCHGAMRPAGLACRTHVVLRSCRMSGSSTAAGTSSRDVALLCVLLHVQIIQGQP